MPEFVFFKSGAPHQSEAPFSELKVCQSSFFFNQGPHQSEAPFSELKVCQSSYFSNQGRPISPRLHFRSSRFARVRIFQIRGAPSVRGSIFGVQGLPEFVFFTSVAPHQSEAPFSEFKVCQRSFFSNQGRPISPRLHFRS